MVLVFKYSLRILWLMFIDDGIALIVVALTDEPTEDARRVRLIQIAGGILVELRWIKYPRLVILSIERRNIVATDRTPVNLSGVNFCPTLDPREQTLDPRAITPNSVGRTVNNAVVLVNNKSSVSVA